MQDFIKHINAQLENFKLSKEQLHGLAVGFPTTNEESAYFHLQTAAWWAAQAKEDKRTRANRNARRCFAFALEMSPAKIKNFSF